MKTFVAQALAIIRGAEREVQALIDAATRERRYVALPRLASIAEKLAKIDVRGGEMDETSQDSPKDQSGEDKRGEEYSPTLSDSDTGASRTVPELREPRHPFGETRDARYPRFVRDNESLVKIGPSSAGDSTYEHRAPKPVVDVIVKRAVALWDRNKRPFSAEALSDVGSHEDGQRVPSYQLYLCLAWLKRGGLIRQHGRRGYSVLNPDSFVSDVQEAWENVKHDRS